MSKLSPAERTLRARLRSEEHTSELQSLMRISYAFFCLKKKKQHSVSIINSKKCNISGFFYMSRRPTGSTRTATPVPYTTLFRSASSRTSSEGYERSEARADRSATVSTEPAMDMAHPEKKWQPGETREGISRHVQTLPSGAHVASSA